MGVESGIAVKMATGDSSLRRQKPGLQRKNCVVNPFHICPSCNYDDPDEEVWLWLYHLHDAVASDRVLASLITSQFTSSIPQESISRYHSSCPADAHIHAPDCRLPVDVH
jgi:hypothetical protein